jgi:hypothetical protein
VVTSKFITLLAALCLMVFGGGIFSIVQ